MREQNMEKGQNSISKASDRSCREIYRAWGIFQGETTI